MPSTAMYAETTPKLTEATTVKQRIIGIKNEITINPTLLSLA